MSIIPCGTPTSTATSRHIHALFSPSTQPKQTTIPRSRVILVEAPLMPNGNPTITAPCPLTLHALRPLKLFGRRLTLFLYLRTIHQPCFLVHSLAHSLYWAYLSGTRLSAIIFGTSVQAVLTGELQRSLLVLKLSNKCVNDRTNNTSWTVTSDVTQSLMQLLYSIECSSMDTYTRSFNTILF